VTPSRQSVDLRPVQEQYASDDSMRSLDSAPSMRSVGDTTATEFVRSHANYARVSVVGAEYVHIALSPSSAYRNIQLPPVDNNYTVLDTNRDANYQLLPPNLINARP
jgi:hypothetical protein